MSIVLSEAQKQEERVKAQQYAELMNVPYVDPFPEQEPDPNGPVPTPATAELTDEQLIELLNKRAGISLSGLDALNALKPQPTEEEIRAEQEKRNTEMLTYGLSQGKFKKEDYDAYQLALANKKDLVRSEVSAQLRAAYPELDDTAIEEKVANYLFEHLPEDDALRIAREKEIMTLSDMKIKEKFKNIVDLPKDFDQYNEGINNKANFERKVQATLPVYKADVSTALKSLQKFTVTVPDSKNPANNVDVELSYSDTDLKEVEEMFLTPDQIIRAVKQGLTIEQIAGEANLVLMQKHLPRLISQAAKTYSATQKETYIQGRKGLTPGFDAIEVRDDKLDGGDDLNKQYDELISTAPVKV